MNRPRTRGECDRGVRPCPIVSCRQNLALVVIPATSPRSHANALLLAQNRSGETQVLAATSSAAHELEAFGDAVVDWLLNATATCALDVAADGEHDAREVAELAGISPGHVRRIERAYDARLVGIKRIYGSRDAA